MPTLQGNVSLILKGSAGYLLSGIVASAAPFVVSLLVSRYLGQEALGLFSVCFALVLAGILVSDLGLSGLIVREFAGTRQPMNTDLKAVLRIRCSASIIAGAILSMTTFLFIPSPEPLLLSVAAFAMIILRSMAGGMENVLKARLYRSLSVTMTIGSSAAHVLLVYLVLRAGHGIDLVFLAMATVETAKVMLLLIALRSELSNRARVRELQEGRWQSLLLQGLPFALIGLFTLVNDKAGLFFLNALRGSADAGLYSAADRFLVIGMLVDSSLFASALPILTLLGDRGSMHRVTRQTLLVVLISGIVGGALLYIGAPLLIGLTFQYTEAIRVLQIVSLSLPALLLGSMIRTALLSMHQERGVAWIFGMGAVMTILLNATLIPHYGVTGAAVISVVVKYGIGLGYCALYLRHVGNAPTS